MKVQAAHTRRWLDTAERFERLDVARDGTILGRIADAEGSAGTPLWCAWQGEAWNELRLEQDLELPFSSTWLAHAQAGAQLLAWRPGRRAVARLVAREQKSSSVVVKAFRRKGLEAKLARQREVWDHVRRAGVTVPDWIGAHTDDALVMFQDLGQTRPRLRAADDALFHDLGTCVAAWQARPAPPAVPTHSASDELQAIDALAHKVLAIRGALPEHFQPLRDELGSKVLAQAAGPQVLTHRDLHDGQLLSFAGRLAILDFDLACCADAALDLANLSAHLELRALQGVCTVDMAQALQAALLAGYGDGGAQFSKRLDLWRRATYLRLALVHALRPPWSALVPILLDRARPTLP